MTQPREAIQAQTSNLDDKSEASGASSSNGSIDGANGPASSGLAEVSQAPASNGSIDRANGSESNGLAEASQAPARNGSIDVAKASVSNAETAAELSRLREEIDAADEAIAALLRVRTSLVRSAARLKSESGEGVVSGIREQHILFHGAQLEQKYGLAPSLMQDLQRRILRQSYIEKGSGEYACAAHQDGSTKPCKVCIVGGAGGMGSYFVRYLSAAAYEVSVVEVADYRMDVSGNEVADIKQSVAAARLGDADWCIVSVPIDKTSAVIKQVAALISPDCILSDLTSVKTEPLETMLEAHQGPVLGLHPMFGPDTVSFVKQVVVAVPGRYHDKCAFILEQMRLFGAHVVSCNASEHDNAMRIIQALRHFTTIAYGNFLRERFGSSAAPQSPNSSATADDHDLADSNNHDVANADSASSASIGEACAVSTDGICAANVQSNEDSQSMKGRGSDSPFVARLMDICSPIYHLELLMVGRLFAQSPELYCDIISASDKNLDLIEQYIDCASRCLERLKDRDRDGFIAEFRSTTSFFGSYADSFLKESSRILALVQDTFAADQ